MFGFGELSRVLKPLELRQHKFDCFTDDCIYLGTVRDGRGIRFLRLSNRKVYVRNDMVVTQGVMPYRSVGGLKTALQVKSIDAADLDIMFNVRWDEHEDGNVNNNTVANTEAGRDTAQQGLRNKTVDTTPLPLLLQGRDTTDTDQGSTEHAQPTTPVSTAHTPSRYVIRRSVKCYAPRVGALTRWCNHTTQPQLQSFQAQGIIISGPQEWARQPGVLSPSEEDGGSLAGQSLS